MMGTSNTRRPYCQFDDGFKKLTSFVLRFNREQSLNNPHRQNMFMFRVSPGILLSFRIFYGEE